MSVNKIDLGNRIRMIRQSLGKTMAEFGRLVDADKPASDSIVSRWERGISVPNSNRLKNIAKIGNVTTEYLINGKQDLLGNDLPIKTLTTLKYKVLSAIMPTLKNSDNGDKPKINMGYFLIELSNEKEKKYSIVRGFESKYDRKTNEFYFEDCKNYDLNNFLLKVPKLENRLANITMKDAVNINSYIIYRQQAQEYVFYELFNDIYDYYSKCLNIKSDKKTTLFFIDSSYHFRIIERIK